MTEQTPNVEPLTRTQVLIAMGATAVVLLILSRLWLIFDPASLLPVIWSGEALLWGVTLGIGITIASALIYQIWPAYRQSADFYLELVIKPLSWVDLVWLGLLPGMSEELLFRGVLLPSIGLTWFGVVISSLCFGVLHYSGSHHWAYVVWAAVVGVALGWSAVATGNLLVPIVAHVFTNFISGCFWKATTSR